MKKYMSTAMSNGVDLAFVEKNEPWKLSSDFFCSKVGKLPSWLSLKPLPDKLCLTCPSCANTYTFLLQVFNFTVYGIPLFSLVEEWIRGES